MVFIKVPLKGGVKLAFDADDLRAWSADAQGSLSLNIAGNLVEDIDLPEDYFEARLKAVRKSRDGVEIHDFTKPVTVPQLPPVPAE